MKKQYNNELHNNHILEKGNTGNTNLDSALSNIKEEPLIFSVEEANYLVENAMTNDVTSSVIKNTIIIGGTVLLSAVFGWMYYEHNEASNKNQISTKISATTNQSDHNERNKVKLSSNEYNYSETPSATSSNEVGSKPLAENNITNGPNTLESTTNSNSSIVSNKANNSSNTSTTKKNTTIGDKQTLKSEEDKKSNSNFSKTIITQRYFDDGSAKMTLEYKNQPARITINSRGIESLFINSEEVDPSYYYLYEDLAEEAFRRSKIEPLAGATHDANAKPNINAMMTGALARRGLIKEGESFSFELTPSTAILNSVSLKADLHKDLLQVYQSAFGSSLPRGGKFIIGKQP